MLVSHVGEIVDSVDVVPEMLDWKVSDWLEWLDDNFRSMVSLVGSEWRLWVNKLEVLLGGR